MFSTDGREVIITKHNETLVLYFRVVCHIKEAHRCCFHFDPKLGYSKHSSFVHQMYQLLSSSILESIGAL